MTHQPLWIGTAGWSVPKRYAANVPAGDGQLERYARALNAVEINSSFSRGHAREAYERWAGATPDGFGFSVKLPRTTTHFARLKNCDAMLDRFISEVSGLGDKLGVGSPSTALRGLPAIPRECPAQASRPAGTGSSITDGTARRVPTIPNMTTWP